MNSQRSVNIPYLIAILVVVAIPVTMEIVAIVQTAARCAGTVGAPGCG